jgi:hypothetical protein
LEKGGSKGPKKTSTSLYLADPSGISFMQDLGPSSYFENLPEEANRKWGKLVMSPGYGYDLGRKELGRMGAGTSHS